MTIYHDGIEHETVNLFDPAFQTSNEEMHHFMIEKGFSLKPHDEIIELKERLKIYWKEYREEQMRKAKEFEIQAEKEREEREYYRTAPSEYRREYDERMSKRKFKPIPPHYLELARKLARRDSNQEEL